MAKRAPKDDPERRLTHPQPALNGFDAWVVGRLSAERDEKPAATAAWIINDWIARNAKQLAEVYGIDRNDFRTEKGLKPHEAKG